jgi:hypothetical protein
MSLGMLRLYEEREEKEEKWREERREKKSAWMKSAWIPCPHYLYTPWGPPARYGH